jgi:hypothetical protein
MPRKQRQGQVAGAAAGASKDASRKPAKDAAAEQRAQKQRKLNRRSDEEFPGMEAAKAASLADAAARDIRTQGMSSLLPDAQIRQLDGQLKRYGLEAVDVCDDGNCLFSAVANVLHPDASQEKIGKSATAFRAEMVRIMRQRAGTPISPSIFDIPGPAVETPGAWEEFDTLPILPGEVIAKYERVKVWGDDTCLQFLPWCPSIQRNIRVVPAVGDHAQLFTTAVTVTPETLVIGCITETHFTATRSKIAVPNADASEQQYADIGPVKGSTDEEHKRKAEELAVEQANGTAVESSATGCDVGDISAASGSEGEALAVQGEVEYQPAGTCLVRMCVPPSYISSLLPVPYAPCHSPLCPVPFPLTPLTP